MTHLRLGGALRDNVAASAPGRSRRSAPAEPRPSKSSMRFWIVIELSGKPGSLRFQVRQFLFGRRDRRDGSARAQPGSPVA